MIKTFTFIFSCVKASKKYFLSAFLFSFLLFACNQERDPCLQPTTVSCRIRTIRPLTDSTVADTLLKNPLWVAIDSLNGIQYPAGTAYFSLLMSPITDSCRYSLQPDTASIVKDTLTFYYKRKLQFLSNACGYTYYFSLLNINTTNHLIDSVKINNADVNGNVNSPEHVQIYF